jgi:uncharacterized protein YabN with tetrapyrrole methylase and pyrophosphatase domain
MSIAVASGIDADAALLCAAHKVQRRYVDMATLAMSNGTSMTDITRDEMDSLWVHAKRNAGGSS